ncbi:MAG: hypothetical protein R2758_02290 [Bacteroidales bacterium]
MSTRTLPNADVEIGARVAKMTHRVMFHAGLANPLTWNNLANRFGEDDANELMKPYYNEPWKFPQY